MQLSGAGFRNADARKAAQGIEESALRQQIFVSACFGQHAAVHYQNLIVAAQQIGLELVRHHNARQAVDGKHGVFHHQRRFGVERRRGFVHQKDRGIAQKPARYGNALFFSARKLVPVFAAGIRFAFFTNQPVKPGLPDCAADFFRGERLIQRDIVADAVVEDEHVLLNSGNQPVQAFLADFSQFGFVKTYGAVVRV